MPSHHNIVCVEEPDDDDPADDTTTPHNHHHQQQKKPDTTPKSSIPPNTSNNSLVSLGSNHSNSHHKNRKSFNLLTTSHPDDIDATQRYIKGDGLLASKLDLNLSPTNFAEGCKLLFAAARNDINTVKHHLKLHPHNINFRDYDRRTALHVAASEGHLEMVQLLVESGAHVNRSDRWGGSALDDAHRHRHDDVIAYLRSNGAKTGNADHTTGLITAAAEGDVDDVRHLIQNGDVDVNRGDYDGRTALHLAAGGGCLEVCDFLLRHGADPNAVDRWGGRPLDDAKGVSGEEGKEIEEVLRMYGAKEGDLKSDQHTSNSGSGYGNGHNVGGDDGDQDENLKIDISELEMIEKIGSGAFGEIYKCRWRGTLVAAKFLKSAKIMKWAATSTPKVETNTNTTVDEDNVLTEEEREIALADFRIETKILSRLRHPNICMLLAYSTTESHEVMVSELMKCSLLDVFKFDAIHPQFQAHLTKKKKIIYALQLAQGMNYLHTCKPPIIHRDLKPANLLIDYSGTLKISDFGLAKVRPDPSQNETDQFLMTGETGSYRFMAPEVFRHENYTETVDIYSYAMILFYLLSGQPPWPSLSGIKAVEAAAMEGRRPFVPRSWDVTLANLLTECWDENPNARPSFGIILERLGEYSKGKGMKLDMRDSIGGSESDGRKCCVLM